MIKKLLGRNVPFGMAVSALALVGSCAQTLPSSIENTALIERQISYWPPVGANRSFFTTTVSIAMRDDVELVGNLFLPHHRQPAPTIVSISPYGRHGGHRLGVEYAKAGLNVIFLEARGRGDSGGDFKPFYVDVNDTQDVTSWVTQQDFSDGQVAMWGSSYGGYNQWMAAATQTVCSAARATTT